MQFDLGYGKGSVSLQVEDKRLLKVLEPNPVPVGLTGSEEVRRSIEHPIESERLKDKIRPGQKIVIVTSDITRPVPSYIVLPEVLRELSLGGAKDEDITVVCALGSHRKHTDEERCRLVGQDVYSRVRCIDSNPDDCVTLGTTKKGTPVDVFREVANADVRICVGNIEFHYFAGYSGGVKAMMPGVSSRRAISNNHCSMVEPAATIGKIEGNPVREDIEEFGAFCQVDFIVNVVLDEHKKIIHCSSGHPVAAHRAGCAFLDSLYKIDIPHLADIVVVSPGGYPKDINLYQAQKALDNASHAVKKGGIILWCGSCREGLGESHFEDWMMNHDSPAAIVEHIKREFVLGAHKAAAIAMVLENAQIWLVCDLPDELVKKCHIQPKANAQQALDEAIAQMGEHAEVIVMPYGGSTLPVVKKDA